MSVISIGWCSLFNAELALSVTMTGLSTALSVIMLPINLTIYVSSIYDSDVVQSLNWFSLILSLVVVLSGIILGVLCSAWQNSTRFNLRANQMGNFAGVSLVIYSALVSSSSEDASLWSQDASFYIGVAFPAVFGVLVASRLASRVNLEKPERVAVAVEACYQNTGIATSVAITMFQGEDQATAIGVPLYYGICEMVILAIYCLTCWKLGWTKAPADENICTVITTSYEVETARIDSPNAIEVVHGQDDEQVFTSTNEGYKVDEGQFHETSNAERISEEKLPIDDKELI
jgi:predicted Na+-dependent transporter